MSKPFEIMAAPFDVFFAPVGEAFPLIDDTPGGNWVKLGTSGSKNITEDGVSAQHPQTFEYPRALGTTGPLKALRTQEDMMISFTLMDVSLEQYRHALNSNVVTDTPASGGVAGIREVELRRGLTVQEFALLMKAASGPYGDTFPMQYQVPRAHNSGEPEVIYIKGEPAGVLSQWTALEDPDAATDAERFGKIVAMDADQA